MGADFTLSSSTIILQSLVKSKERGNVVAIWASQFNKGVCLSAVDEIQSVEITGDKLVTLKKLDLQGGLIASPKILLSEIEKVVLFNAIYSEHLLLNTIDEYIDELSLHIRKREQLITADDLKIIIIRNINSGRRIKITLRNQLEIVSCFVKEYNPQQEVMLFTCELDDTVHHQVHLSKIEELEFEFYFQYKGLTSKNFKVN